MKLKTIYSVQWAVGSNQRRLQFETNNLCKVIKHLGLLYKEKLLSIATTESRDLALVFEYTTFFVTTEIEKLIDCEKL